MAKKRADTAVPEKKAPLDDHKGVQLNFRAYDQRLVDAIQEFADRYCYGNRNQAMNRLIELGLKTDSLWPPGAAS